MCTANRVSICPDSRWSFCRAVDMVPDDSRLTDMGLSCRCREHTEDIVRPEETVSVIRRRSDTPDRRTSRWRSTPLLQSPSRVCLDPLADNSGHTVRRGSREPSQSQSLSLGHSHMNLRAECRGLIESRTSSRILCVSHDDLLPKT